MRNNTFKNLLITIVIVCLACSAAFGISHKIKDNGEAILEAQQAASMSGKRRSFQNANAENIQSKDIAPEEHSTAALALKDYLERDPSLMAMMEKSIKKAYEINPDPDTNPVSSIEKMYSFIDWNVKALPWNLLDCDDYPTLYDHIDQSVDYLWFLFDQPLEELEGKGYYYPTLQYHEPIAGWLRDYSNEWGTFLSTEESWNDDYYEMIKNDPNMNMQYGWYGDSNEWSTFNEWFSRKLVDPKVRPIADTEVVAPADSKPQGVWDIDKDGNLVQKEGVIIKSANFTSVADLIGPDSEYSDAFAGGTLTHTFLNVNDYHRYHFPVSGTIKEVRKIKATNGAGGITVWHPEIKRYVLEDAIPGWQMIETRDCVIIDTEDYGLVAVLPIGMSQICSCNFEDTVKVGVSVQKGDPMGYFLFGGSDIVMVFQDGVKADMVCPEGKDEGTYEHVLMGEAYMKLQKEE
ncbi:phosphatidylserine decarboxylase [Butyrivibrio sp. JL13D10]|uniref:phosphatidylserine decarboxylase n=1 Tax=Butyrivibrio sp. JL13D10 TaxID=3236815 RepID=UPI0038B5A913